MAKSIKVSGVPPFSTVALADVPGPRHHTRSRLTDNHRDALGGGGEVEAVTGRFTSCETKRCGAPRIWVTDSFCRPPGHSIAVRQTVTQLV